MDSIPAEQWIYLLRLGGLVAFLILCVRLRLWRWVALLWRSRG